jgi:EAL domain-containing protein (putative c-di-GMP-specific phosphodiesterase class I)
MSALSFPSTVSPPGAIARLVELALAHAAAEDRLYLSEQARAVVRVAGSAFGSGYESIVDFGAATLATPAAASPLPLTDGHTQPPAGTPATLALAGQEIGYQGVLQGAGSDAGPAPGDPLAELDDAKQLVALDRLSRILHAINFFGTQRQGLLFLDVHEQLLKSVKYDHGRHFSQVLLDLGLNPARIVIGLPENAVAHRTFVSYLIKSYRSFGFKVAGTLPNAGQILAVPEIGRLDFIKIDAASALRDGLVKPLVNYAAHLNTPLVFKQVEHEHQAAMLRQFDVRFMQGALFAGRRAV